MPRPASSLGQRFAKHAGAGGVCHEWRGPKTAKGYGLIQSNESDGGPRRYFLAHRVAWELFHGAIPDNFHVCHKCDNPSCVNPGHLFLGTNADNHHDKAVKDRSAFGLRNGNHKLNPAKVREIRRLLSGGLSHREIASKFSIDHSTVSQIWRGVTWRRV